MDLTHYLPNTEQRIQRLRRLIRERPAAIICQGYSATELENRIEEIKDCNICYASMSAFWVIDKYTLSKIGCSLTIAQCSPIPGLNLEIDKVVDFLERDDENLFITAEPSLHQSDMPEWFNRDDFVARYNDKLLIYDAVWHPHKLWNNVPSPEYPLHFNAIGDLTVLISLMVIGKAQRIILFGADGGEVNPNQLYYRQAELGYKQISGTTGGAMRSDTINFNTSMSGILERVIGTYQVPLPDIANCSLDSHYTIFRKISYDEAFGLLREAT